MISLVYSDCEDVLMGIKYVGFQLYGVWRSSNSRIFHWGTAAGPVSHLIVLWFNFFSFFFSFLLKPFSPSDHEEQFEHTVVGLVLVFWFVVFFFNSVNPCNITG